MYRAPVDDMSFLIDEVLEAARGAMLRAKEQGRNCVVPYEEDQALVGEHIEERARTRQDLENALATERFVLRAQPIMQTSVADGSRLTTRMARSYGSRPGRGFGPACDLPSLRQQDRRKDLSPCPSRPTISS